MNELRTERVPPLQRTSVIQLNPAFLSSSGASLSRDDEDDESEDEFVNVDESDDMETETTDAERLANELKVQTSPIKLTSPAVVDINEVTTGNTESPVITPQRRRCSPKARFEPYERSKTVDENENRLLGHKTISGGGTTTTAAPHPLDNVLVVVEEIKKQAALTAQKPAHQSQPYLTSQVGKLVLSSKQNGESAPNAVIRLNKNNNRNDDAVNGISFSSEEGQNRPFKCHPCNIAFRISGHLSRHIKSRGHQLKVSQGLQDDMINSRSKIDEKPKHQDEPIDLSLSSKNNQFKATPATPTTPEVKPKVEPRHPQHHHHRLTPPKVIDSTVPIVTPPSSSNSTSSNSAASTRPMKPLPLPKQQQQQQQPVANSKTMKKEEKVEITENGSRRFRCGICDIGFRFQGHLDRHMRSTTHMSMEEAVKRTGRRPNAQD